MRSSLRTRIIALAVGTALLVIVLAAVPLAVLLHNKAYAETEQRATYAAQSVADYLSAGGHDGLVTAYVQRLNKRDDPPVTVFRPDGSRVGATLSAAVTAAITAVPGPHLDADKDQDTLHEVSRPYVTAVPGGEAVQVFTRTPDGSARAVALVADGSVREALSTQYGMVALVATALVLVAWAAAEVTGRRLVRPLQETARTAIALRDGDLSARAPVSGPDEVAAVAVELNALAARIGELLTLEREAAADLSHRLRTPLTAVRLAVEALPGSPRREEIESGLDRLERTLTQIIRAARRGVREGVHPRCDAAAVTLERVAFWRPLAEDQRRSVALEVPSGQVWIRSSAEDLGAALDALIENVIAHTEDGTAFSITLRRSAVGADLVVADGGPGIPVAASARGASDRGSSGLGLDIARAAAEATGGGLKMQDVDDTGRAHALCLHLHREA